MLIGNFLSSNTWGPPLVRSPLVRFLLHSTNFRVIDIKSVLVELLPYCYVIKLVLVEVGYVVPTSTNFA